MEIYLLGDVDSPRKLPKAVGEAVAMCTVVTLGFRILGRVRYTIYLCWLVIALYTIFISKKKLHNRITTTFIVGVIPFLMGQIVSVLVRGTIQVYTDNLMVIFLASDVIHILLCTMAAIFLKRYSSEAFDNVPKTYCVMVILAEVICQLVINNSATILKIHDQETWFLANSVLAAIFFIFSLSIYYLFYVLSTSYIKSQEIMLLRQKEAEVLQSMKYMNLAYDEMRVLRHEFKNKALTMKILLDSEQYEKLEKYLNNYLDTDAAVLNSIDCGNRVLNKIFNIKLNSCRSLGVEFDVLASVPSELPFEDGDLTSLLVNLIDNAVEASVKSPKPHVSVKMRVENNFCLIAVFNSVVGNVLDCNPELMTTKDDKAGHGIGLKVVKSIVKKYNGHMNFEQEGECFKVSVMLEMS